MSDQNGEKQILFDRHVSLPCWLWRTLCLYLMLLYSDSCFSLYCVFTFTYSLIQKYYFDLTFLFLEKLMPNVIVHIAILSWDNVCNHLGIYKAEMNLSDFFIWMRTFICEAFLKTNVEKTLHVTNKRPSNSKTCQKSIDIKNDLYWQSIKWLLGGYLKPVCQSPWKDRHGTLKSQYYHHRNMTWSQLYILYKHCFGLFIRIIHGNKSRTCRSKWN